ncbi:hypothetical protein ND861_05905 [Leptospira sp. 2 VSF19]|uniref:Uncharacterized protein n=1 Tax=Leptospira soteropolitanensis TaxID=2950025 RepID=A0AAW5VII6_9LEPT|nr:hypothetical protein [Leptospira soteropolitanensis]MCW7492189.1 hypothetical protein [Leptospira soteropolitanensis]MCW7499771.1 hypothetical protein [Leptospira soteropolitanensis]MCW7522022.1 hypothetical protein [Leptospira soteropolitanensis]MCW7525876.1 hypothetical protein [Leptospira soteropolitanensis]MCW7530010.1 hypothetical protein [Leptospira soteropolitanensis]
MDLEIKNGWSQIPLLVLFWVSYGFCLHPNGNYTENRKTYLREVGLPILVTIRPRHKIQSKELQLFIKTENLTNTSISKFQILFFALDDQKQILIPEDKKTPELICSIEKQILPNVILKCHVGPFVYANLWSSIHIQSISFTTADQVRHVISEADLDDVTVWL